VVLFIENVCCLERNGALDCSARITLDCEVCTRSHVTAPISHGIGKLAMAARVTWRTREYVACTRSWFLGLSASALKCICVCSIVVAIECIARDMTPSLLNSNP
jgi:hypothetical protein